MYTESIQTEHEQIGRKYWQCNKCGHITYEKPENKNTICEICHKGRFKLMMICKCGTLFHPERENRKYCSAECGIKYKEKGGTKGKHYPQRQRARTAICEVCGKEFKATKDYKDKKSKYCSKECWSKRSNVINHCKYCGKEIITFKSQNKMYCNEKCRNEDYKTRFKGANSPLWQGGKTNKSKIIRTSAEYAEWRTKVFERDKFTCQKCGKTKCKLEAHHIKELCNYPELACDVNNGQTLCHECHKETENYCRKAVLLNAVDSVSDVEEAEAQ